MLSRGLFSIFPAVGLAKQKAWNERSLISIIIPTCNRFESLGNTLAALTTQLFPQNQLQVIIVDDGSDPPIGRLADSFPFSIRKVFQEQSGATAARNHGARCAAGEFLIFLDDDIDLAPGALGRLVQALEANPNCVLLGSILPAASSPSSSAFASIMVSAHPEITREPYPVHFSECMAGVLAIRREDFYAIGEFQDSTGGWPNWDDVEFGYRAHKLGYSLLRCPQAIGWHRDRSLVDLKSSCRRTERAAHSAVLLFQKYPEIYPHLPMFHDKSPISLQEDSPGLIAHKLFHAFTALPPVARSLEGLVAFLERAAPRPRLLRPLYRWLNSVSIYRGFHQGLREFGAFPVRGAAR